MPKLWHRDVDKGRATGPWPLPGRFTLDKWDSEKALTLAGTGHFASFHGTRGGGGTTPLAVSPLIELELRGKNERVARREMKRLMYKLKVLGQPVTSVVRLSAEE